MASHLRNRPARPLAHQALDHAFTKACFLDKRIAELESGLVGPAGPATGCVMPAVSLDAADVSTRHSQPARSPPDSQPFARPAESSPDSRPDIFNLDY